MVAWGLALGWTLGGGTLAVGSGLDVWGKVSDSGQDHLLPHGVGWAGRPGLREAFDAPAGRERELLLRAGRAEEAPAAVLGVLATWAVGDASLTGTAGEVAEVTLDLNQGGPLVLSGNTAGQQVPLWLRNDGAALELGGLDLKIGITGGALPAPTITGVNLRAGDLFTLANSVQGGDAANTPQTQFWSVSVNDPFAPALLPGAGTVTRLGTLTLSTAGISTGDWSLTLFANETALLGPFGDSVGLNLVGGVLTVVPEPGWTAGLSGLALAAWGVWRRASSGCRAGGSLGQPRA